MTWGDAMKDIKEKPTAHMPRSNATGEIPKAALKKAWAEAKEKSRTMLRESTSTQGDGDYTTAQDTSSVVTDTSYSVIKQNTDFTVQQGRKIARKQIENTGNAVPPSKPKPPASTPPMSAVSAPNKSSAARCPMQSGTRAVGQICPASGRKKKSSPPRPRHEIFVV